jgi:hypothetical protein
VRIIKEGKSPVFTAELTCKGGYPADKPGCGTVFEVDEGDVYGIREEAGVQWDPYYVKVAHADCPICGNPIRIDHAPGWLKLKAKGVK